MKSTDPFLRARQRFLLMYASAVVIIIIIVVINGVVAFRSIEANQIHLEQLLRRDRVLDQEEQQVLQKTHDLEADEFFEVGLFGVITVALGLIFLQTSLRPIRRAFALQERFIHHASHEIRTPLSVLLMRIQALQLKSRQDAGGEVDPDLAAIEEQTERISHIIDNLLDLSQAEQAAYKRTFGLVDVSAVAESASRILEDLAARDDVAFRKTIQSGLALWGNRTGIEEIIINIGKNAIRYTAAGGTVTLTVESVHGGIRIHVEDTGTGIAKKDLPHIFESFYRGGMSSKVDDAGMGLGLAIVREIVQQHNGEIKVESEVGKGTHVTVVFPSLEDSPKSRTV